MRFLDPQLVDIQPAPSPTTQQSSDNLPRRIAQKQIQGATLRLKAEMLNIEGKQTSSHNFDVRRRRPLLACQDWLFIGDIHLNTVGDQHCLRESNQLNAKYWSARLENGASNRQSCKGARGFS